MRKDLYIYMIGALFFLGACKKEPLPNLPEGNDPVYQLSGKLGGEEKNFIIGEGGTVLSHGLGSENGLITYYGEMVSVGTDEKIRIEFIRQETPIVGGALKVIERKEIPFLVHESATRVFDFGGVGNQVKNMMLLNDEGDFEYMTELTLNEFGIFSIPIIFPNYSEEVFEFVINYGYRGGYLDAEFESYVDNDSIVLSPVYSTGKRHDWFVNDEHVYTGDFYKGVLDDGIFEVKHIVYDDYGNGSEFSTIIQMKGGKRFWQMRTKYVEGETFVDKNYGRVKVSFYKNGQWFSSDNAQSNMGNVFEIDSIETFAGTEDKVSVLKFDLNLDASLVNDDKTDSLELSGFNGTFSVGLE